MLGFDPEFTSSADFSRKITDRIWPERGLDRIREYYAEQIPVRTPLGVTHHVEDVVRNSLGTLAEFPDRHLHDEDFIWSEDEPGLFYNSHRILSVMTHRGEGLFGKPTGARVAAYTLADCVYQRNKNINEYLVRDNAGIVRQIGQDVREYAQRRAEAERARDGYAVPDAAAMLEWWTGGPSAAPIGGITERYAGMLRAVWEEASVRAIRTQYDDACTTYAPGAETLHGRTALEEFTISYLAAFPRGTFNLHHWACLQEPNTPTRIALRWSFAAQHAGYGRFGPPCGQPVAILALTHAELWGDRVMRQWHAIDETAIWKQIAHYKLAGR